MSDRDGSDDEQQLRAEQPTPIHEQFNGMEEWNAV